MNKLRDWIRLNGEMSEDGKSITYNCDELEQAIAEYEQSKLPKVCCDCKQPLPPDFKTRCESCYDKIYFPK